MGKNKASAPTLPRIRYAPVATEARALLFLLCLKATYRRTPATAVVPHELLVVASGRPTPRRRSPLLLVIRGDTWCGRRVLVLW